MRFMKKSKGIISIFLILILVPLMTMSVVLVDGSRARSAQTMAQESSDLAAMSVLSNYNNTLKDEFGLFALDESCDVEKIYNEYLQESLNANGGENDKTKSKTAYDKVQETIWGKNKYKDLTFWNLYNFNINNTTLSKKSDLADPYVLQNQIVEYTKYRGIGLIAERLELLDKIKNVKGEMKTQQKVLNMMKEKEEIDSKSKVEESIFELKKMIENYNNSVENLKEYKTKDELNKNIDNIIKDYKNVKDSQYQKCIKEINDITNKYDDFRKKYEVKKLEPEEDAIIDEVKEIIETYNGYRKKIEDLKGTMDKDFNKLEDVSKNIKEIIEKYEKDNDSEEDAGGSKIPSKAREYIKEELDKFQKIEFKNPMESEETSTSVSKDGLKKMGEDVSKKTEGTKEEIKGTTKLDDDVYNKLPSKTYVSEDIDTKIKFDLDGESSTHTDIGDITDSLTKDIQNIGDAGINDALVYSYILGDFKTRVTGKGIKDEVKMPSDGFKDNYHVDWRYKYKDGEHDLRGNPKTDRKTKFKTSEVEYIFAGKPSEENNERIVYAWIYSARMANNLISVYMNEDAKNECKAAAIAASLATEGAVPVPVFYNLFMIAWAAGETAIDLNYLIEEGFKIPLIKTKDDLYIKKLTDVSTAINNPKELIEKGKSVKAKLDIRVTYEDYLVMMLMFVNRETRLTRTADLVQLNMIESGKEDFEMKKAYTYIEANSEVSIKYLFKDVSQFSWGYNNAGGITFNNKVYQGY